MTAVRIIVAVSPLLTATAPSTAAVETAVAAAVDELVHELGIDAQPVVGVVSQEAEAPDALRLYVGGRRCRFPETALADALDYVDARAQRTGASEAADALASRGGVLAEVVALACREGLRRRADLLLPASASPAQRAVLRLGMSLGDRHGDGVGVEETIAARAASVIELHVEPAYLAQLSREDPDGQMFGFARKALFEELGVPLPPLRLKPEPRLRARGFAFRFNATRTLPKVGLRHGTILVDEAPEGVSAMHDIEGEPARNPATGQPGTIVAADHREALEAAGLTVWDPLGYLVLSFAQDVRRHAGALMTRDVAERLLTAIGAAFPALAAHASRHVRPEALAPVLRELLRDGVPIRNLRRIVELVLRYETTHDDERPAAEPTAFVRSGLADQIATKAAREASTIVAYLIDPSLEGALVGSADESDDAAADAMIAALRDEMQALPKTALRPALLTADHARAPLHDVVRDVFPEITVLGYGDVPPDRNVQPVARVGPR